jgi:hypothetical protein
LPRGFDKSYLEVLVVRGPEHINPQITKGYACRGWAEGLLGGGALLGWPKVTRLSLEKVCRVITCITGWIGFGSDLSSGFNERVGIRLQDLDLRRNRAFLERLLDAGNVPSVSAFENVAQMSHQKTIIWAISKLIMINYIDLAMNPGVGHTS